MSARCVQQGRVTRVEHRVRAPVLALDSHPLMSRMHKPDPKLPADQQDKRSVIAIEMQYAHQWLAGTVREAGQLLRLPSVCVVDATPLAS